MTRKEAVKSLRKPCAILIIIISLISSLNLNQAYATTLQPQGSYCGKMYAEKYKHVAYCSAPVEIPDFERTKQQKLFCCKTTTGMAYERGACTPPSEQIAPAWCENSVSFQTSEYGAFDQMDQSLCEIECLSGGYELFEGVNPTDNAGYCDCYSERRIGTKEFQYFAFVNKPTSMTEGMTLEITGLGTGWSVESLYPDSVSVSGNFITIRKSTSFIIHSPARYEDCICESSDRKSVV